MNKAFLFLLLFFSYSALAEERFALKVDPLRIESDGSYEHYLVSIPADGIKRARVFLSGAEGLKVYPAEKQTDTLQAMMFIPTGSAVRYYVQIELNDGSLARSEPRILNPRDEEHRRYAAQIDNLMRNLEVIATKIQRQDQYLGQLEKLSLKEKELIKSGMLKRLDRNKRDQTQELKELLTDMQNYFDQLQTDVNRLAAQSATAHRATELKSRLEGYRSLFEALINETET